MTQDPRRSGSIRGKLRPSALQIMGPTVCARQRQQPALEFHLFRRFPIDRRYRFHPSAFSPVRTRFAMVENSSRARRRRELAVPTGISSISAICLTSSPSSSKSTSTTRSSVGIARARRRATPAPAAPRPVPRATGSGRPSRELPYRRRSAAALFAAAARWRRSGAPRRRGTMRPPRIDVGQTRAATQKTSWAASRGAPRDAQPAEQPPGRRRSGLEQRAQIERLPPMGDGTDPARAFTHGHSE